jgi:hypothetical protein
MTTQERITAVAAAACVLAVVWLAFVAIKMQFRA